jgi:hypothetical protein
MNTTETKLNINNNNINIVNTININNTTKDIDLSLDLADLFNKYGSDKDRNGYSHLYSILFDKIKNDELHVLEIGIGTMVENAASSMRGYMPDTYKPGASLRAWQDYFKNSKIYGMDVQPDTQFKENRIETFICDTTDSNIVKNVMNKLNNIKFDIIIDDGWHWDEAQKKTLINFFPYLKDGGIYIIEDIYPGSAISQSPNVIKEIVGKNEYFFVGLKNNQCIIHKKNINATGFC